MGRFGRTINDVNVILINYSLLYTWVTNTQTMEYTKVGSKGEPCRGADIAFAFLFRRYAREQPQWSNRTSELMSSWFLTCGNRLPTTRWGLSGAIFRSMPVWRMYVSPLYSPLYTSLVPPTPLLNLYHCGDKELIPFCNLTTANLGFAVVIGV